MRFEFNAFLRRAIAFVLAIVCLQQSASAELQNEGEKVPALVLIQNGSHYGHVKTIVTKNAVRIEITGTKIFLLANAPKWRVVFLNAASNKGMDMDYPAFLNRQKQYTFFPYSDKDTDKPEPDSEYFKRYCAHFRNHGSRKYLGLNCQEFVDLGTRGLCRVAYTLSNPYKDKEAEFICEKFFDCITGSGIPLLAKSPNAYQKSVSGTVNSLMDITSITGEVSTTKIEETKVAAKLFKYPDHFKQVGREIEVSQDDSGEPAETIR